MKLRFVSALRAAGRSALLRALPARARLPFDVWLARLRGVVEPELRYLHLYCPRQGSAVDVGAHHGHYSYRLSKLLPRVVAFDVNAALLVDLENYNPGNIRVVGQGLSSAPAELPLFIPLVDGRPLTGWGSLTEDNLPEASSHLRKSARVTTLDAFGIDDVSFIKIDVEGHELEVLKGAVKTLVRCHPMLLVEVKSHNSPAVDNLLADLGYSRRRLEDLIGITGSPENAIFIANKPS